MKAIGGRPVPRLHQALVVRVEARQLGRQVVAALVRLRDHHHHRVRQRAAREHEQLEHVVEGRRVRAARPDDRQHLREVVAEELRRELRLARAHPVDVAAQRVDLAVVRDQPVRVRELPARERVRREARVHERERVCEALVEQIGEVAAELRRGQHSLVDDACATRSSARTSSGPAASSATPADHVELPLERVRSSRARARRRRRAAGSRGAISPAVAADVAGVDGNVAPADHPLPLVRDGRLEQLLELGAARPRRAAGSRRRRRSGPRGGSSASSVARKNASGIWTRIPAPSPVLASAPAAPRCSRLASAFSARSTVSCDGVPSRRATNATPHASCSYAGS